jgi:hypothetical protein
MLKRGGHFRPFSRKESLTVHGSVDFGLLKASTPTNQTCSKSLPQLSSPTDVEKKDSLIVVRFTPRQLDVFKKSPAAVGHSVDRDRDPHAFSFIPCPQAAGPPSKQQRPECIMAEIRGEIRTSSTNGIGLTSSREGDRRLFRLGRLRHVRRQQLVGRKGLF